MCGVFGYTGGRDDKIDSIFIESMAHRGPDAKRVETHKSWNLGHLRLSIIDTSTKAHQPMVIDGNVIIFNGEIYNYIELKKKYLRGIRLKTTSDTEILLRLLIRFGVKILNELDGMFAFAWYNVKKDKMVLVRDRFGVKPLYWMKSGGRVLFASETKPLAKLMGKVVLNPRAVDTFIKETVTDDTEESFISGIQQIRPGHYLEIAGVKTIKTSRWYHYNDFLFDKNIFDDYQKTVDFFEDLLTNAIEIRHRSDVPVAITLSGGLDSTTIYTLAKERLGSKIQPITYTHGDKRTDEAGLVAKLTASYGDKPVLVKSKNAETIPHLKKVLKFLEFPIWNNSALAYWDTYEQIHKLGYKVIIEGHGSDELLGGYPYMVAAASDELFYSGKIFEAYKLYDVYTKTLNSNLDQTTKKFGNLFSFSIYNTLRGWNRFIRGNRGSFERTIQTAFDRNIIPVVLRTFDRLTMAHSIESRSPFMDYRIVEFCRAMPMAYKVNHLGNKAILREILKKYGKDEIYKTRAKMGFAADVPKFFNIRSNKSVIAEYVQRSTDIYPAMTDGVLQTLKKKVGWGDVANIWKLLSIQIIKEYYDSFG